MKYQLRDYQKAAADAAVNRLTMKMSLHQKATNHIK